MRARVTTLTALLGAAGLAALDVLRELGRPTPFPWAWFTVSCAAALCVVACISLIASPDRRNRLVAAIAGLTGSPPEHHRIDGSERRRAVIAAIASSLVLVAIGLVSVHAAPDTPTGDDTKTVHAALAWHVFVFSGARDAMPAEPKPPWVLAGLLSGGTVSGALLAARMISLACGFAVTLLVSLAAGTRAGPLAAIASAFALILIPNMILACSYASEDAPLLLLFGGGALLTLRAMDRPRLWPLIGLLAGLAGSCKATAVALLPILVLALILNRRIDRRTWPWLAAAVVAAVIPLLPPAYYVLWLGNASRDSELLGLLTLHGPEVTRAKMAHDIPAFPGWGRLILDTTGIMRVGDIVTGAFINFKPTQLWILPALIVPAVLDRRVALRRILAALLVVVLPLLGILGWKTGDVVEPFYMLGPVAALLLGRNLDGIIRALRRRRALVVLVAAMLAAAIVELAMRALGVFS
jgi:4-amino-4-deoxy-L-arabinose transferase-like glycosyltransferase